jgi:molecular chaperone DnaK (HSP70)
MSRPLCVGIDLGTTHSVVAWAEAQQPTPQVFEVPQLVSAGEIESLPLLASSLYPPLPEETLPDPWADAPWVVGAFARERGQEVPGRLVASAKSWLCYAAVDRSAPILPWGLDAGDTTPRLSPVEASERILRHVQTAWDQAFPARPLREQSIVLTVPASFDEVARELTVTAAQRAGLNVRLLEEPQAAFYDFMARAGSDGLERLLRAGRERATVLVCDVGGGTTDLTLIEVTRTEAGALNLERVAVGRHLLLGGDNVDLALAYRCEATLVTPPARLEPSRFSQLVLACRGAKEKLLGPDAPESVAISIAGSGSALVGSTTSTRLTRAEVEAIVLDGFLPSVTRDAVPQRGRAGLVAFGLPYEHDPAITRHISSFFARHSDRPAPDALLLNGGLFRSHKVAERLRAIVSAWSGEPVELLPQPHPDLAVARGAVVYGLSLAGQGLRIGGGAPLGFYIGIEVEGERRAVCVVPRGAREGERHLAKLPGLALRVGQPVRFELFSAEAQEVHAPGAIVAIDDDRFLPLPPLSAVFEAAETAGGGELAVALEGELSAVGTVELACVEEGALAAPRRFRLAFDLRESSTPRRTERPAPAAARSVPPAQLSQRLEPAEALISRVFGKGRSDVKPREIKDLVRELERTLGERRTWTLETNRGLFDLLQPCHAARRRSEDHERVYWMLCGYCLRPGFGHPKDPSRVASLAPLFEAGVGFAQQTRSWQQFWIALRRVAPGLNEAMQVELRALTDPWLAPAELKLKKPKQFRPLALEELLELASWLERVPVEFRIELGRWLLERTWTSRDPRLWSALGRIGARVPAYASAHHVLPPSIVERWLDHLLRERWQDVPTAARAASQLARVTGDRARDLSEGARREVVKRLEAAAAPGEWLECVRELVPVAEAERADWFGDELPVGLLLR